MRTLTRRRRALATTAVVAALSATLAACGGGSGSGSEEEADGAVTIWTSMDAPVIDGLEKSLQPKAEEAGIDVNWERVTSIEQADHDQAAGQRQAGHRHHPAARRGREHGQSATARCPWTTSSTWAPSRTACCLGSSTLCTFEDEYYGLPVNTNIKSIVFYPKKAWEQAKYPTEFKSLDELEQFTSEIEGQGETPWCLGIFSEGSVGWPATDWFEDLVARFGGVDFYNAWVDGEEPFDSDPVRESADWFESNVVANAPGDPTAVDFGAADDPMWEAEPGCWMLKQGTFMPGFFPKDVQENIDEEVGVFAFPPAAEGDGLPIVGGGDLATMLVQDSDTEEVMNLLAESDIGDRGRQVRCLRLAAQGLRPEPVPEHGDQEGGGCSAGRRGVPVRRVRPDAGRGRRGLVLGARPRMGGSATSTPTRC